MKLVEKPGTAPERVCVYGPPKSGKSTLATSLPWGEHWGERAVLFAADVGGPDIDPERAAASALLPVLEHNKERLITAVPTGDPNWMEEAWAFAQKRDWPKDVGTIIWDTMSMTSRFILRLYANSGVFQAKHSFQFGDKRSGSWHVSPDKGEYGAAQNTIEFLTTELWNSDLNLIILFHDDFLEPESGSPDGLIGGPSTVGKKAIKWVPSKYDTVLYLQRLAGRDGNSQVVVHTHPKGIWTAGVRESDQYPIPAQVKLERDPVHFWTLLKGN